MTGALAITALACGARHTEASLLRWLDHDLGLAATEARNVARLAVEDHAHDVAERDEALSGPVQLTLF